MIIKFKMKKMYFFLYDIVRANFVSFQFNQNINTDPFTCLYARVFFVGWIENEIFHSAHAFTFVKMIQRRVESF